MNKIKKNVLPDIEFKSYTKIFNFDVLNFNSENEKNTYKNLPNLIPIEKIDTRLRNTSDPHFYTTMFVNESILVLAYNKKSSKDPIVKLLAPIVVKDDVTWGPHSLFVITLFQGNNIIKYYANAEYIIKHFLEFLTSLYCKNKNIKKEDILSMFSLTELNNITTLRVMCSSFD